MNLTQQQIQLLLLEISRRSRIPPKVMNRYLQVNHAHEDSTERIFLDHGGLPACAAYLFTKYIAEDVQSRQTEKQKRKNLITFLDKLSVEDRQAAANQLKAALQSNAVQIEGWMKKSRARTISRIKLQKNSSDVAGSIQSDGDSGLNNPYDPPPGSNEPTHQIPDDDSSSQSSQQDVSHERDRALRMDAASIAAGSFWFPEYLAGAIERLSISLTAEDNQVSSLNIHVTPKRVEFIAWKLFRVCLENEAGIRYACIGHTRLIPTQRLALEYCCVESIPFIFGDFLAGTVSSGPVYQEERLRAEQRTKCISMVVPMAVDECARIVVLIPLEQATEMQNVLSQFA